MNDQTQTSKDRRWRYSLTFILMALGILIVVELNEFISGVLGAFTIYVLMRKTLFYLTETKKIKPIFASIILLLGVILLFLIPLSLISLLIVDKISTFGLDPHLLFAQINEFLKFIEDKADIQLFTLENLSFIPQWGLATVQGMAQSVYSLAMNAFVLIFVLYFMFIGAREFENFLWDILPFKRINKRIIRHEVNVMIRANAIGIPLLAIIQGGFAYIGYLFFDVNQALLYAILTAFATIIPLVGTTIVWIPLGIILIISGDLFNGIGLLVYGLLIISGVDNLFRFILQKKLANVHPLITIFGVIFGLKLFGFWGIIFGPLIISLFILLLNIYRREYLIYSGEERFFSKSQLRTKQKREDELI